MLWPDDCEDKNNPVVTGEFIIGEQQWRTRLNGGIISCERSGNAADIKEANLPPPGSRDRYRLALPELLKPSSNDNAIAKEIQNEINGGLNIEEAKSQAGFAFHKVTKRDISEVRDKEENYKSLLNQAVQPAVKERDLQELISKLDVAEEKSRGIKALGVLRNFKQAKADFKEIDLRYCGYDEMLSRLKGAELGDLKTILSNQEDCAQEIIKTQQAMDKAAEEKVETGLKGYSLEEMQGILKSCEDYSKQVDKYERDLNDAKRNFKEAAAAEVEARYKIGRHLTDDQLKSLDIDLLKTLSLDWLGNIERYKACQEGGEHLAEIKRKAVEGIEVNTSRELLETGINYLQNWVRQRSVTAKGSKIPNIALWISATALAGLAFIVAPLVSPLYYALILLAAIIAAVPFLPVKNKNNNEQTTWKNAYEKLEQMALPVSWDDSGVEKLLAKLQEQLAGIKLKEIAETRLGQAIDINTNKGHAIREKLDIVKQDIIKKAGIDFDLEGHALYSLVQLIVEWVSLRLKVDSAGAKKDEVKSQFNSYLEKFNEWVAKINLEAADDFVSAGRITTFFARNLDKWKAADNVITNSQDKIERLKAQANSLEKEKTGLLKKLDPEGKYLVEEIMAHLNSIMEKFAEYEACKNERKKREGVLESAELTLKNQQIVPELKEKSIEEINQLIEEAEARNAEIKILGENKGRIENEIATAKQKTVLTNALGEYEDAVEGLRIFREDKNKNNIGIMLAEWVGEQGAQTASKVLALAQIKFKNITKDRYELRVKDGKFIARQTSGNKELHLGQLSSGTRAQLLIALRTAYIENQESEKGYPKLPLILDEALATSDDRRASDIIQAVIALVKEGRQVFYLTAQADEVEKWQAGLKKSGIGLKVITLPTDIADEYKIERREFVENVIPPPGEQSYYDYGTTIQAVAIDPWDSKGSVHIWHLLDDTQVLFALLKAGYSTWGQLESLLTRESVLNTLGITDVTFAPGAITRAAMLDHMIQLWRQGRGRPIGLNVINESGAVSSNYMEAVAAILINTGHDAAKLIEALKNGDVKGFRSNKTEDLEKYFNDNGFIDSRDMVTRQQAKTELLSMKKSVGCFMDTVKEVEQLLSKLDWE